MSQNLERLLYNAFGDFEFPISDIDFRKEVMLEYFLIERLNKINKESDSQMKNILSGLKNPYQHPVDLRSSLSSIGSFIYGNIDTMSRLLSKLANDLSEK